MITYDTATRRLNTIDHERILENIQMGPIEVEYVRGCIRSMSDTGQITEWGSGGSTIQWLFDLREGQKLITIEHNKTWYESVIMGVEFKHGAEERSRFDFLYIPEEHGINHGYGNIIEEHPSGTREYLNPRADVFDSEIFFVDGIARAACISTILHRHTKEDPVIFIHDFRGRENWYDWVSQFFRVEYVGETLARLYINKVES
jgi:hypothetical protein